MGLAPGTTIGHYDVTVLISEAGDCWVAGSSWAYSATRRLSVTVSDGELRLGGMGGG